MDLLTRRLQLGRELDPLNNKAEQPNHLGNSPDAGVLKQFKDTDTSIMQLESHILNLLLLANSAKKVKEGLTPANPEIELGMPTSYPIPFNADIKGSRWILPFKDLVSLGIERLRQDFRGLWRILANLIENPLEVRVSSPIGEIHAAPIISFFYTAYLGALLSLHLLVMKYYNLLLAAASGLVVYTNPLRADDTLQVRDGGPAQAEPRSIRDCHHFAAPRCCVPNICQCGDASFPVTAVKSEDALLEFST
ncbi:hypothetical protein G7054_g3418 [Neopestalotiopsis clavispora]|nr:hypothetical protein G7054_g3418 [Neopestalotiopsis clavispora]